MASRGKRLVAAGLLLCMLPYGCKQAAEPASSEPQPSITVIDAASPTPTLLPLVPPTDDAAAVPDMTFDESGNIWFSDAMKAQFTARTFVFARAPRVLIYHTHAREAFREESTPTPAPKTTPAPTAGKKTPTADDMAAPDTPAPATAAQARSDDPEKTVVHLGDVLAQALMDRGFTVFHDRTDVESPALATAYERSAAIMARYEDIDLFIDLHRNAADPVKGQNDVAIVNGERCARMFFVVGTGMDGASAPGTKNWRENYTFAYSIYEQLQNVEPRLVKENRVKQGYYNQQKGLCLLAEIGHNANSMRDAEHTLPDFADALAAVCRFS